MPTLLFMAICTLYIGIVHIILTRVAIYIQDSPCACGVAMRQGGVGRAAVANDLSNMSNEHNTMSTWHQIAYRRQTDY